MGKRQFSVKSGNVAECPKCGNATTFVAHSSQFAEDCCEVWVVCQCGYDPTADRTGERVEDVWGSLDNDTIASALAWAWTDVIRRQDAKPGVAGGERG